MTFFQRASQYANGVRILTDWLGQNGTPVDKELAQKRADICLTCPFNSQGWVWPEKVADAISEHVALKNTLDMRVNGEKSLHTCSKCQCALRLKIHVPISVIRAHPDPNVTDLPAFCWQKTEL
jgi:hypothetical protein